VDEAIWAGFGVIAALIGIGIIVSLALRGGSDVRESQLRIAVDMLAEQCTHVCGLPERTAMTVDVTLPADARLEVQADRVCVHRPGSESICARCACTHAADGTILDLTGASPFYESHAFACRYERLATQNTRSTVNLTCAG
jgi:hypothetical protein